MRVVIVEPYSDYAEVLSIGLKMFFPGLDVSRVDFSSDDNDIVNLICDTGAPALVLTAYLLPGINGVELARRVKQRAGDRVDVVLVTAWPFPHSVASGTDFFGVLEKPFPLDDLRAIVDASLAKHADERKT